MSIFTRATVRRFSQRARNLLPVSLLLLSSTLTGCASFTNPTVDSPEVRRISPDLLGQTREGRETIPLTYLRMPQPDVYRLAGGDLLGIWIESILGEKGQVLPTFAPTSPDLPPALGYPIPVAENGTISLPLVGTIDIGGMSVQEAEARIRKAYIVDRKLLKDDKAFIVTLMRPRRYSVLVMRQDSSGGAPAGGANPTGSGGSNLQAAESVGTAKRGSGQVLELPAYQNDVLTALAKSGGLPGLDALNEVIIERAMPTKTHKPLVAGGQAYDVPPEFVGGGQRVHIPLRVKKGESPPFKPADVILNQGDIVFIEARDAELFYTGGLLPAGEHPLPRDYDIDVLEAVTRVRGGLNNAGLTASNLTGSTIAPGLGGPSPSLLTIIRKTPGGGQVVIRVDLNRAQRDRRENILVQPKDLLLLQETPGESLGRYISQVFRLELIGTLFQRTSGSGVTTTDLP